MAHRNDIGSRTAQEFSISPDGEKFPLPRKDEFAAEMRRVEALVKRARGEDKEIVVVMGVGFVGVVMAAIVADTTDRKGRPSKFVIGCQRPSTRSYWKIPVLNRGSAPVKAEDPEVDEIIERTVKEKKTFTATFASDVLKLADCVVIDVQCDYLKNDLGNMRTGEADMAALEATMRTVGEKIEPKCLVLIETTVAPGTTEFIVWPILKRAFAERGIKSAPLLAHSFERVMPGREYVRSIRDFWRVCSGCNAEAAKRVEKFLREVLNTKDFPLTVMDRPIESETTKIVENSYRATILAFLNEWSLFAERNGVDLTKVITAIRMRPTHSNMIFPGPGIGGYCLPKDGGLGYWAYQHILGFEDGDSVFKIRPRRSTSTIRAACMSPSSSATRSGTWGATSRGPRCSSAGRATGRMSGTRDTAGRRWSCGSSPRWGPSCACTTPTWNIGTSSRCRKPTRPPAIHGAASSATRTI